MANGRTEANADKNKKTIQVKQRHQPAPERKKWHHINWDSVEAAYINREDVPSLRELADEFNISEGIVFKTSTDKKWVIKRERHWLAIQVRVQQKCSKEIADRIAENLLLIKGAKNLIAQQIRSGQIKATLGDIDKLSRAELLLLGQADSRPDAGSSFENLMRKLNEERKEAYNKAKGIQGKVIDVPPIEAEDNKDDSEGTDKKPNA